ncbi:MAG: hypothetical protein RLZZ164_504 [Actinomycetota bacterium]
MLDFITKYLSLSHGEVRRTTQENVIEYRTGTLVTEIQLTYLENQKYFLQSKTKWFKVDTDEALIFRVCYQMSIIAGFTIAYDADEKAIYSLTSASLDGAEFHQVYQQAKLRIFLLLTMHANIASDQLFNYLANLLDGEIDTINPPTHEFGREYLQAISRRPPSPNLLLPIAEIKTELETEIAYLTGRMNYEQIVASEEDENTESTDFGFGESEMDNPSIVASFHVSYKGANSFGDAHPLHVGIVIDRTSEAHSDELNDLAWTHFNNSKLSLLGYYYTSSGMGGCYVSRLSSFVIEVLSREIDDFAIPANTREFQIKWCLETFSPYRHLENLSRNNKGVSPEEQTLSEQIAHQVRDQWRARSRNWPTKTYGSKWPIHEQYLFDQASIRRLANIYISGQFEDRGVEYGIARFTCEQSNTSPGAVVSLSICMPNEYLEFTSPVFEYSQVNFEIQIEALFGYLDIYYEILAYEFKDVHQEEYVSIVGLLGNMTNCMEPEIDDLDIEDIKVVLNFVRARWDLIPPTPRDGQPARLIFEQNNPTRSFKLI